MRPLALASWFALLALTILWESWLAPARHMPLFWLAVKGVPLLAMLPGLLRDWPKAYLGSCLLALLYFIEGVVLAWTLRVEPLSVFGRLPLAWIEIIVAVAFIVSAGLRARQRLRAT
ncbi:MAG TPA: DUF2069 domain-containing protein [Burkholderiales bacterium]|nr:DUF2069 domain-containing protein [Burkholderiales bacterium]